MTCGCASALFVAFAGHGSQVLGIGPPTPSLFLGSYTLHKLPTFIGKIAGILARYEVPIIDFTIVRLIVRRLTTQFTTARFSG